VVVRARNTIRPKRLKWSYVVAGAAASLLLALVGLGLAFPTLTYKGVPLSIILRFLQDPIARQAYFDGDKVGLHRRLDDMNVEAEIKAFYRPQIEDEQELDRYIHQLLYDDTGYVGNDYRLGEQGKLVPKSNLPNDFWQWFALARQLNLAANHETKEGVLSIVTPEGSRVPYALMSKLYTIPQMQQLTAVKQAP
jgi:hypothetical protein